MDEQKVKRIFKEVLLAFPLLADKHVSLARVPLKNATMNARPIFSLPGFFSGKPTYRIYTARYVKDSTELTVDQLPEQVLRGWFAHELGHIMDYRNRSTLSLIWFGIRYLLSGSFRKSREFLADQYAIRHGFHDEIIAAKKFILENDLLTPAYKAKIDKYYMPIEQVRWHTDNPASLENLFIK